MNNATNHIDIIERYFDNDLSDQEKVDFISRLQTDSEFKKIYDREKLLINAIRFHGANNDLRFLKEVEQSLWKPELQKRQRFLYYYAAAACITLLILVSLFVQLQQSAPEELFAEYFQPYPNVFEPTLRGASETNARAKAFQAYENGDYEKAAAAFNALLKENEEAGILLLLGNANLAMGKTDEAVQNFTDLISQHDDLDIQGKWYLSLSYLKEGKIESARKLFEELAENEISYAKKAKELLKQVD